MPEPPLIISLVLVADLGHLFKDTESFVLAWGTDGLWLTTAESIAESIAFANTTIANTTSSITGDAPWDVTRHTHLRSVSVTRTVFCLAYLFVEYRRSTNVDEVRTRLQCHHCRRQRQHHDCRRRCCFRGRTR